MLQPIARMLRPYEKRVASTGGHPSRGDREFAPSDTQEFSLPLQKAGEFKGLLPVPPGPGDDGDAEGTGLNGASRHGRLSGESTRWRSKM